MKKINIPIFVPHRGCPHLCVFCNQKRITGVTDMPTPEAVDELVRRHLSTIDRAISNIEIAFFGGSFTAIPHEEQQGYLEVAKRFLDDGRIDGIRLSTRPDAIDEDILAFLKDYGVSTVELGVQSMDDRVLRQSRRGHTIADVIRASNLIKYHGLRLGLQMMIGLPGDSSRTAYETAKKIALLKPDEVRIYPTLVLVETPLHEMYMNGTYTPLGLDEAIESTADILPIFYAEGIRVIRIGLQATDGMISGDQVKAGPFHPAFRHLVESRMFRHSLEEQVGFSHPEHLVLGIHPKERSNLVGQHRENLKYLKTSLSVGHIEIVEDDGLPRHTYRIIEEGRDTPITVY